MNIDLSIIVPIYNEKATINQAIEQLLTVPELNSWSVQYIIVDDGSTDGTVERLKKSRWQKDARFTFVYNQKNQGKGTAIRSGLIKAVGKYTIIHDADLEYDPNDIVRLWKSAEKEKLTAIYGSRNLDNENKKGSPTFYYGGKLITFLTNLLYSLRLTDEASCYKLFKTDFLKSLPLVCQRFEFCPEVTALSAKQKIKIPEIPIRYFPRNKAQGKKINWQDGFEAIWTLLYLRFKSENKSKKDDSSFD